MLFRSEVVALELCRLKAYKDEYEVARLHSDGAFAREVAAQFGNDARLRFHLAAPLFARRNAKGELIKRPYSAWMMSVFRGLARFKGLRGTPLDIFGYSAERRSERALIIQYQALMDQVMNCLQAGPAQPEAEQRYALCLELLGVAEEIRGFGHVKARNMDKAQARWHALQARWHAPARMDMTSPA